MAQGHKAIPEHRDRLQSALLVWIVGLVLAAACIRIPLLLLPSEGGLRYCLLCAGISLTFGLIVWALKAATPMAAICGSMICFLIILTTGNFKLRHAGLIPLVVLFLMTFAATRAGRHQKALAGLSEPKRGRSASQIVANLGTAALVLLAAAYGLFDGMAGHANGYLTFSEHVGPLLMLAALAEATADTVSSEIGQAFGGAPYLLTTFRRTKPGTDGAMTLIGTLAGILGAAIVVPAGTWSMGLQFKEATICLAAAVAGLFFDSLLGATVERRGWLGNDLVNFSSTVFAAAVALLLAAH